MANSIFYNRSEDQDLWVSLFSDQAINLKSSEIRALFSVVSRPEVVSLAGGMPNLRDLPLADIGEATRRLIEQDGSRALQYGDGHGWDPLRQQIVELMRYDGIVDAEYQDVVITTGSQQALDLTTEMFVNPGDIILTESPSYVGALGVFGSYEADVRHVAMDDDGLRPDALQRMITELRARGKQVKFLYTVPNFHNPCGVTLTEERRHQIVDICKSAQILIVEDNPYGLLGFHEDPPPSIRALWPEGVIYLGSFSKMFAPGYRIGWALAPRFLARKLIQAAEAAILCPSMMGQMSISRYLAEFDWFTQIKNFRAMYEERWQVMNESLQKYMPFCKWTNPKGGFYTWVTVPDGIDTKEMLPRAVEGLVAYVPGTAFYYDDRGRHHMRLSFCYPTPESIEEGVKRLSKVILKEMELNGIKWDPRYAGEDSSNSRKAKDDSQDSSGAIGG